VSELLWTTDLDLFGAETQSDGDELIQDVLHVIEQDLGSNLDDLTRGLGVANILNKQVPSGLTVAASTEIAKDDRVQRCDATIAVDDQGNQTLNLTIYVLDDVLNLPVPIGTTGVSTGGH
jgi:hypothetical protein